MFSTYSQEKKAVLRTSLHEYIQTQKANPINQWSTVALEQLELFMQNGKMLRGTLVFLGYESQTNTPSDAVVKLALAMEFFHAGLLIHDDIMDNAETRRGKPSIHASYVKLMQKQQSRFPKNTGKSLAICTGNVAFFLGFQLLSELNNQMITAFCSKELQTVNYAQMQDISFGATNKPVSTLDEILSLYQTKTGRYSILLPLTVGAMLGNASGQTLKHLAKFSDAIGIAYQLTDDTLDLFGHEEETGKTIGTDIREGKQTLFIYFLRQLENEAINTHLMELFSKGDVTADDMRWVQDTIKTNHIDKKITDLISKYQHLALECIKRIPMKKEQQDLFFSFVEYLRNRIQ